MEIIINESKGKTIDINEEHAFEELYRQYFIRLFRFCFSIVHQKEPAEEIVNDVFLHLWKKRNSIPPINNLEVYLYVSVRNRSLNYLRDNRATHTMQIEERMIAHLHFQATPESLLVSAENTQKILSAIQKLPPRCRLIFKLIKEDGLKYKDVARLLDLSVKTVEAQITLALKKILLVMED